MRKNLAKHTAKKLPLAKRVLALCFALIFVCSCLLPAFANGTGVELDTPDTEVVEAADPGTEPEPMDLYDEPAALDDDFAVADEPAALDDNFAVADEPAAMDDDFAVADEPAALDDDFAMGDEPAAQGDEVEKPVVDDEPAAMDNEVEKPVEGGEPPVADDTPAAEGATKTTTDASGNIVYEYDTSGTTFPDDDAAALPDGDQVLDQMDAAFSIPTNIYHFWLKKMSDYDLADIAADAETAEMTVEQYLAMYGTDKGCYHIMTAADGANLKDYQFADPTSNDDPEGNSRTFAGWYYTDDLGDEQKFVFDEFLYISEGTTVEVYAKWTDEENLDGEQKQEEAGKTEEKQEEANPNAKYQKMFDSLMDAESIDEVIALWDEYCASDDFDSFYEYVMTLDEEDQQALERLYNSISEIQDYDISLLDVDSEIHANVLTIGEQITLKCTSTHYSFYTYEWYATDSKKNKKIPSSRIRMVNNDDGTVTITALSAGEVYIYHRGTNGLYWDYTDFKKFTIQTESYGEKSAEIFYLKSPIYSADRNDEAVWLPDSNPWEGKVDITGAIWETGPEYYYEKRSGTWEVKYNLNKNIYLIGLSDTQVTKYVKEWPDRSTGATWTLKRGDDYFNSVLTGIMADTSANGYRAKLAEDLGISESQIDENKIDEITLTPYKISHNHDSDKKDKYHIDCNVSVKSSQAYTAVFWVKQPGSEGYQKVFAKSYPLDKYGDAAKPVVKVTQSDIGGYILTGYTDEIDDTKTRNGITYRFVGWYPENDSGTAHGNDLISDTGWTEYKNGWNGYWPENDLQDGTVNFYAEYVPESMAVNIKKTVTGLFGDKEKNFTFEVTSVDRTFELSNGQNTTDKGISIQANAGSVFTIKESGVAGYTVRAEIVDKYGETHTYNMKENEASDTKTIDILVNTNMIVDDLVQIEVINERDATIDNGVLLDTLPYILILVVVAGGGVLLFLRKRKNDDDE